MEITTVLEQWGLSEEQAKVYSALLALDSASVSQIATSAGIKRPTCYLILDDLVDIGLINKVPTASKLFYQAHPPQRLLELTEEKVQLTKSLIPMLLSVYGQDTLAPRIKLYEGKQAVQGLFDLIVTELKRQNHPEIVWFADWGAVEQYYPGELERSFKMHTKLKVHKREIIRDSLQSRELVKRYSFSGFEAQFISPDYRIHMDFAVTGNKVAIFSLSAPLFGVLIEHIKIADSFRAIFELSWLGCQVAQSIDNHSKIR